MAVIDIVQSSFEQGIISDTSSSNISTDGSLRGASDLVNLYVTSRGNIKRREGFGLLHVYEIDEYADIYPYYEGTYAAHLIYSVVRKPLNIRYMFIVTDNYIRMINLGQDKPVAELKISDPTGGAIVHFKDPTVRLQLKYVQKDDYLLITHRSIPPVKLKITSDTSFAVNEFRFSKLPYHAYNGLLVKAGLSQLTFTNVVNEDETITSDTSVFTDAHVGQLIKGEYGGLIRITKIISGTSVLGDIEQIFPLPDTPSPDYEFKRITLKKELWQLETGYQPVIGSNVGYPHCATFYNQRLWLGGLNAINDGFIVSKINQYDNFNIGDEADAGIFLQLSSNEFEAITHFVQSAELFIFTSKSIYKVHGSNDSGITPTTISVTKVSHIGSNDMVPVVLKSSVYFADTVGNTIYRFKYDFKYGNYVVNDVSSHSGLPFNKAVYASIKPDYGYVDSDVIYFVFNKFYDRIQETNAYILSINEDTGMYAWSKFIVTGVNLITLDGSPEDTTTIWQVMNDGEFIYVSYLSRLGSTRGERRNVICYNNTQNDLDCSMDCRPVSAIAQDISVVINKRSFIGVYAEMFLFFKNTDFTVFGFDPKPRFNNNASRGVIELITSRFTDPDEGIVLSGENNIQATPIEVDYFNIGFKFEVRFSSLDIDTSVNSPRITTTVGKKKRLFKLTIEAPELTAFFVESRGNILYTAPTLLDYTEITQEGNMPDYRKSLAINVSGGVRRDHRLTIKFDSPVRFEIRNLIYTVQI